MVVLRGRNKTKSIIVSSRRVSLLKLCSKKRDIFPSLTYNNAARYPIHNEAWYFSILTYNNVAHYPIHNQSICYRLFTNQILNCSFFYMCEGLSSNTCVYKLIAYLYDKDAVHKIMCPWKQKWRWEYRSWTAFAKKKCWGR